MKEKATIRDVAAAAGHRRVPLVSGILHENGVLILQDLPDLCLHLIYTGGQHSLPALCLWCNGIQNRTGATMVMSMAGCGSSAAATESQAPQETASKAEEAEASSMFFICTQRRFLGCPPVN